MKTVKPYLEHIFEECNFLIEKSKNLNYEKFIKDPVIMKAL